MTKPTITINELDAERLDALLAQPAFANTDVAAALNAELDRADIVPTSRIPAHVVTMNSRVRFRDCRLQKNMCARWFTLPLSKTALNSCR